MLPLAVRFNSRDETCRSIYREFSPDLENRVVQLLKAGQMDKSLSELSVRREMLPRMADEAEGQWTAQFNPVPATADDLLEVYQNAF